jgi:SAM-dependent methyltransferase
LKQASTNGNGTATSANELRERMLSLSRRIAELDPNHWYAGYLHMNTDRLVSDLELVTRGVPKGGRVLDIGCSPPFVLATLASLGYDAVGLDVQPWTFARSQSELGFRALACNIEEQTLPFEDESFDAVLLCEVFEHLRLNPVRTMHEIKRIVRRGGFLYLTTPNLYSFSGIAKFLLKRSGHFYTTRDLYDELDLINIEGYSGHVREYTHREVEGFLRKVGFSRLEPHFRFGGVRGWTRPLYRLAPSLRPNVAIQAFR